MREKRDNRYARLSRGDDVTHEHLVLFLSFFLSHVAKNARDKCLLPSPRDPTRDFRTHERLKPGDRSVQLHRNCDDPKRSLFADGLPYGTSPD